jgi:coenzyme F420-0:L-glutamate ligase/coenzyme F420-1:gamma-L-glutamate ligase
VTISIMPVRAIGEILPGADLAETIVAAAPRLLMDGDVLVLTQKIISKAEGRFVELGEVGPSEKANLIAEQTLKDPRLVELVLRESNEIVRIAPHVLIVRHRLGFVMANAGIDQSNIGPGGENRVLLLPVDPDASAEAVRAAIATRIGRDVAVIVSDSFGRPWREGVLNVAIGAAGMASLVDERGKIDRNGRPLGVTQIALADAVACAAGLVLGEAAEGIPAAIVRGVDLRRDQVSPARAILRPVEQDLFR